MKAKGRVTVRIDQHGNVMVDALDQIIFALRVATLQIESPFETVTFKVQGNALVKETEPKP